VKNLLRFLRGHETDVIALSAKLDGALDQHESARLDAHVSACDACTSALEGLRATRAALRGVPEVDVPRSFRLRAADVEPVAAMQVRRTRTQRWAPMAAGFAAIALAVIVGASLYNNGRGGSNQTATGSLSTERANAPSKAAADSAVPANSSAGTSPNAPAPAIPGDTPPAQAAGIAAPDVAQPTTAGSPTPPDAAFLYDGTATAAARDAARPGPTAADQLQAAAGQAGSNDRGNNSTALRVIEIIAVVVALAAAAIAFGRWRRGERRS
jgi:hypothetical protein